MFIVLFSLLYLLVSLYHLNGDLGYIYIYILML